MFVAAVVANNLTTNKQLVILKKSKNDSFIMKVAKIISALLSNLKNKMKRQVNMSEIPSLKEEINRKAFETLERINSDFTLGKINKAQFKYGIDIAWSLVSGLIAEDIFRMFEILSSQATSISYSQKSYFRNKDNWIITLIDSKTGLILFKLIRQGVQDNVKTHDMREESNPSLAGKLKMEELTKAILNKGFFEI